MLRATRTRNPILLALPGAAIMLTVLGLNLLGDALNTALNPRLARRSRVLAAPA